MKMLKALKTLVTEFRIVFTCSTARHPFVVSEAQKRLARPAERRQFSLRFNIKLMNDINASTYLLDDFTSYKLRTLFSFRYLVFCAARRRNLEVWAQAPQLSKQGMSNNLVETL